jgi:REP element-mobilizing transposase RayT
MANTYTNLFYHIVFTTKGRVDLINSEIEARVWAYIGGIARKHEMTGLQVGGVENHIHALIMAKPVVAPSQVSLAGWLRDVFSKQIPGTRCYRLHPKPA